jgi:hypothetical protein
MAKRFLCLSVVLIGVAGCSSDSSQPASASDGGGGKNAATGGASGTGGSTTGGSSGSGGATGTGGGSAGQQTGGSASLGDASNASPECVTFCSCMAKNCPDKIFTGGCLPECAAGTGWDLPCRQNMCKLVPDQPNNDHCTHAFGTSQCN